MSTSQLDTLAMPEPSATKIDRVRYLIKLFRKTQAQFGALISVDPSNMSKFLSGRIPITDGFINRIVVNLGISKKWLENGEGVPFANGVEPEVIASSKVVTLGPKGAPVYNVDVTAGFGAIDHSFEKERIVGRLDLPSLNPKYPVVQVSGESMAPRVANHSYISIRPIDPSAPIFWGQMYLVVMNDYRMLKVLRRHPDPSKVILHSYNPDFDDMEIEKKDICQLFFVDAVLNFDIIA